MSLFFLLLWFNLFSSSFLPFLLYPLSPVSVLLVLHSSTFSFPLVFSFIFVIFFFFVFFHRYSLYLSLISFMSLFLSSSFLIFSLAAFFFIFISWFSSFLSCSSFLHMFYPPCVCLPLCFFILHCTRSFALLLSNVLLPFFLTSFFTCVNFSFCSSLFLLLSSHPCLLYVSILFYSRLTSLLYFAFHHSQTLFLSLLS